jgi:RimJ/RimL family protein N-acetyltransferase
MPAMTDAPLSLRRASAADRTLLFGWANDPVIRARSFAPGVIDWAAHCRWFEETLRDPARLLYLLIRGGVEPIGQIRFDRRGRSEAEISLSLAAGWRGQGLAAPAIRLATTRAMADGPFDAIHALVKPGNEPSRRAFRRAGYVELEMAEYKGCTVVHFTCGPAREKITNLVAGGEV